jgi:serine/threonine-protein kinase
MWIGNVPQSTSKGLSGTPYFMAPELWDGETPSIRTDIFSLGVTFYHFLTKEHPFIEDDRDLRISKVVRLKKLFEALGPKGSEGDQIAQFITKCLALGNL